MCVSLPTRPSWNQSIVESNKSGACCSYDIQRLCVTDFDFCYWLLIPTVALMFLVGANVCAFGQFRWLVGTHLCHWYCSNSINMNVFVKKYKFHLNWFCQISVNLILRVTTCEQQSVMRKNIFLWHTFFVRHHFVLLRNLVTWGFFFIAFHGIVCHNHELALWLAEQ